MSGAHTAHDAHDDQQDDDRAGNDPTEKPTKDSKHKSEDPNNDEPNEKLDGYSCVLCRRTFDKRQSLGGHMRSHYKGFGKEKLQKELELVNKQKQQQLSTSHNSHLNFGGGLATGIAPDPYAPNQVPAPVENQEPTSITVHPVASGDPISRHARSGIPIIPEPTLELPTPVIEEPPEPTFFAEPPTDLQLRMDEYFANHLVLEMHPLETLQFFFTGSSTSNPALVAFELAGPFRTEFLQFWFRYEPSWFT